MARYISQLRRGEKDDASGRNDWLEYEKHADYVKPLLGELVIEYDNGIPRLKIGDGVHNFSELPYISVDSFILPKQIYITLYGSEDAANANKPQWEEERDADGNFLGRYKQVVSIGNVTITAHSKVDISLTPEMVTIFSGKKATFVAENENGVVTVYCVGQKPKNTYKQVPITVTEVELSADKVIGNTVATPNPQPDWLQDDENAPGYIQNKPEGICTTIYTNEEPLLKDVGGILASNHPNGFNNVPIADILTELLYPYTAPVINSFSLNPSAGVKEMNVPFTVNTATVKVTQKSKSLQSINLYKDSTLIESKTEGVASGGTFTFNINETLNGSSDASYKVTVVEAGDDGATIASSNQTYDFVYPYFYGVIDSDATIDSETILGFTKSIRAKGSHSYSYTTNNQRPVIAYPKSYVVLKSIIDPNNFTQDWMQDTITINNGSTINDVEYYVYVGGISTATATYKFNY